MRKILLTLLALLSLGGNGAWADTLPASTWDIQSALPTNNWVEMGGNTPAGVTSLGNYTAYYRTQEVTLETAGMIYINFLYSTGNHMLEILGVDALNGSSEVVASDYHYGYTGGNKNLNDYFLNGLSAGTYTLRYIIHNGNTTSSVGNITLRKYEADVVASLPQLTTDENNPKYYSIGSYNRGGYLTSNGAGQGMTHVDFAAGSSWYFTAISGNNSGSVIGGVIAHCSDGTQMKQNWQTAATGQTVYILPNGVNTNGLSISKTLPISGSSCCDANNTNTGVGNWSPSSNDWQGTTWVIEPTVPIGPTGYYYFKGMADRYPYLYSDFVGKSENSTYHHSPLSGKNGEVWKVTNSGTTFTITNGEGLPLTIGSTTYETLTLSAASAGPDYYFTEAINLTNWGNDTKLTTWAGHPDATDNHWTFELADVSTGVYNVVIQGYDTYITYSGQNAKDGGFFVAASIAVGDLTVSDIDGYEKSVSISDRTITVSYNKTLTYTLTDENDETYSWSATGPLGVAPTITGCAGYSLSNEVWDNENLTYTADITFPFAVSSNSTDNYNFIGQFNNKNNYSASEYLWHVSGTSIIIHNGDLPTTEDADLDKYLWSIIPAFSDGAFTFTIKNKSTGTYVYSTETENSHASGAVTLSATATPMTYVATATTGTCSPISAWYLPSTTKYLSANSVNNGANDMLGVFGSVHDGISSGFPTSSIYGQLISNYWSSNNIAAQIANAGQCGYPSATNEYIVALNGVKTALDGDSYPSTANSYNNLRTWYQGALSADVVKPEGGKFYKFKSPNNRYIHAVTPGSIMQMNADGTSADAIFYIPYAGRFLSYTKGYAMSGRTIYNGYYNSGGYSTYTIDHYAGHGLGTIRIKGGNYLFDYSSSTDIFDSGNGTDANRCWTVEEVTTLPVTISAAEYATLYAPVALTIPSGVTAYTATDKGEYLTLTPIDGTIPANTGVILKGVEGSYNFEITTGGSAESALSGTVAAIERPNGSYILATGSAGIAFYQDGASTIPGFRAYLTGTSIKGFKEFRFGTEDAINAIAADGKAEFFDLSGRQVSKPVRGLYIVNGKKVIVK